MPIKKSKKEFEVKYIYRPSPDAEERLQKAFDILFEETLSKRHAAIRKNNKEISRNL